VTSLSRKLLAEFVGTALLLAAVVGSGIMGAALSPGNAAVALLANAGATAAALYVLIVLFGPVSGAHFNPIVTLALRLRGEIGNAETAAYVTTQIVAAVLGVLLAHAMFDLPLIQPGTRVRTGEAQWLSEAVASFGLLLTILIGRCHKATAVPALVASYIFAAYWFTASTSFANPAVTLARSLTQTFAGIRPADAPGFIVAQVIGMAVACGVAKLLTADEPSVATK
jgi:glycerol uptake facilitator-like aquaporin